jgi:hypothetical protein
MAVSDAVLTQILAQLDALQVSQQTLQAKVCFFFHLQSQQHSHPPFHLAYFKLDAISKPLDVEPSHAPSTPSSAVQPTPLASLAPVSKASLSSSAPRVCTPDLKGPVGATEREREKLLYPGRVNLTSTFVFNMSPCTRKKQRISLLKTPLQNAGSLNGSSRDESCSLLSVYLM